MDYITARVTSPFLHVVALFGHRAGTLGPLDLSKPSHHLTDEGQDPEKGPETAMEQHVGKRQIADEP